MSVDEASGVGVLESSKTSGPPVCANVMAFIVAGSDILFRVEVRRDDELLGTDPAAFWSAYNRATRIGLRYLNRHC
jgi:hypothetical protein